MKRSFIIGLCLVPMLLLGGIADAARDTGYRSPKSVPGATTVSVDEARWLHEDAAVFIDVRNTRFYNRGHIPGAIHLDLKYKYSREALEAVASKDLPVVFYSSGVRCGRAAHAARMALEWGYKQVYYYRGGIIDWRHVNFPEESVPPG